MGISGYNLSNYQNLINFTRDFATPSSFPGGTQVLPTDYEIIISTVTVTQGLDVTITIKNIKGDGTSLPWPVMWIHTGWDTEAHTPSKRLKRYWTARSKFQVDPFGSIEPFSSGILDVTYGLGAPNGIFASCFAFDNQGSGSTEQTIGISTNYPYTCQWTIVPWHDSPSDCRIAVCPSLLTGTDRIVPDYIKPDETKTIKFWLRWTNGAGESYALSVLQPYIDHIQQTYVFDNPPKLTGRIAGTQVADESMPAGYDNKYYRSYMGTRVTDFTGWYDFLDALVEHNFGSISNLKNNSYRALQIWAISGFVGPGIQAQNFVPDIFTSLPDNLANSLEELKQWQLDKDFKIIIWCGRAFSSYRSAAAVALDWNAPLQNPLESGYYTVSGAEWVPSIYPNTSNNIYGTDWSTWSISNEGDTSIRANIFEMAKYVYGLGLDALPEQPYDPWIDSYLAEIRETYPWLMISGESHKTDRGRHLAPTYYFPETDSVGYFQGRCPLMNAIFPNYSAFVQKGINADNAMVYGQTVARSQFIESQGMMPLAGGALIMPRPAPLDVVNTSWGGENGAAALTATISSNGVFLTLKFSPPAGTAWNDPSVNHSVLSSLSVIIPHATEEDRIIGASGGFVVLSNGNALVTVTLDSPVYVGESFYTTCDGSLIIDSDFIDPAGFSDAFSIGGFFAINNSTEILSPAPSNLQATISTSRDSVTLTWT